MHILVSKANSVTSCEMSMIPHCLDTWLWGWHPYAVATVYSPARFVVLISVRGWVNARAIARLEVLGKLEKCNGVIGKWNRGLLACSLNHPRCRVLKCAYIEGHEIVLLHATEPSPWMLKRTFVFPRNAISLPYKYTSTTDTTEANEHI
jgi:hypothetical protein